MTGSAILAGASIAIASQTAFAQTVPDFNIRAQPVEAALIEYATQADVSIALPSRMPNVRSAPVRGAMSRTEALSNLLEGTGLRFEAVGESAFRIIPVRAAQTLPSPIVSEDIIVTAARRSVPLSEAPRSITHTDEERLLQLPVNDAHDLAQHVSGLQFTDDGAGRSKIYLRGVSDGALSGSAQSTVGLYLDGVRLTYAAPDPQLRLTDVARVDVMRGPQGALYGAGSIGGILSIESNAPDPTDFAGALLIGAETTRDGDPGREVELVLNIPVVSERLALRVAAYDESNGGWLDNPITGATDTNATTRRGVRVSSQWDINADWRISAFAVTQAIRADDGQYLSPTPQGLQRTTNVAEPYEDDFSLFGATLRGDTAFGQIESTTASVRHEIDNLYDVTGSFAAFGVDPLEVRSMDKRDLLDILVHETRLSSPTGARIPWFVGLFYADGEAERGRLLEDNDVTAYGLERADRIQESAIFGEITWPLTAALSLSTGARAFRYTVEMTAETVEEVLGLSDMTSAETSYTDLAPDIRLSYKMNDDIQLYLAVSEGYRGGGVNAGEPVGAVLGPDQPLRLYSGDELWTYEIGARGAFFDDTLQLSAAVFYNDWRRVQTDALVADNLPFTGNVGHGRAYGFEVDLLYAPVNGLSVRAHMVLNDASLTRVDPTFPAATDNGFPGVPDFSLSAGVRYERPLTLFGAQTLAFGELDASYVGSSAADFTSTARHDPRTETDAVLGLTLGRTEAMLYVRNLLDQDGETFSFANPFAAGPFSTRLRPRTIGLQLRYRF